MPPQASFRSAEVQLLYSYRNALRAVRYTNNSTTPSNLTRTVTFTVNDGTDNSNTQSRNISVTAVNNPPVLASIEGTTLAYTEGDGADEHHQHNYSNGCRQCQPGLCSDCHYCQLSKRRRCAVIHQCQWHNRFMECLHGPAFAQRKCNHCQLQGCPSCGELYKQQRYTQQSDPHGHLHGE